MIKNIYDVNELDKLAEDAYGMARHNLNAEDVEDYMAIASAARRMHSRKLVQNTPPEGGLSEVAPSEE